MLPVILWFRADLRLADNPALDAAVRSGHPLICLYIDEDAGSSSDAGRSRAVTGAARWWMQGSLVALDESLRELGGRLYLLAGHAEEVIEAVSGAGTHAVYWNRRYDGPGRETDARIKSALKARRIPAESFNASLLHEPWTILSKADKPFRVFTPFWRALRQRGEPDIPIPPPARLTFSPFPPELEERFRHPVGLDAEPQRPDWAGGMRENWRRGEAGAGSAVADFIEDSLGGYAARRDRPDMKSTSRLSPFLRFGNISVRQIWHAVASAHLAGETRASEADLEKFRSELGWREFSYHVLFHNPPLHLHNLQPRFDGMPWREDAEGLRAWQTGRTGFPIVDAAMRELWATGFMHNRARMICASFLAKHLLIDWRRGEEWFWDTLVDADPANNPASWQWVSGSGADAAPYFRILNPILQAEKFDPEGIYVRRWIPELAKLPAGLIHRPWTAESAQLSAAGIRLGETYPRPVVDLDRARRRALAAWRDIRGKED